MRGGDYSQTRSLREAIEICRRSLTADGRAEYAPLVTEERVRAAIRTALESQRHRLEKRSMTYGADYPWVRDKEVEKQIRNFEDVVRPVCLNIADNGAWPPGASFVYTLFRDDDNLVRYDGLGLRLQIETPGAMFMGFALSILDIFYGGVPPPSEDDE